MSHRLPPDDKRCRGTSKASGQRCPMWAIKGGTVCYHHGGAAKQVRDKANQRLATQKIIESAEAVLAHEGITPVEDPLVELGKLASASKAMMEALGARVNDLNKDLEVYDEKRAPHIRAEVQMWERSIDRTHRLLDSLVKHGYTERQVTIAENEALLVAGVIRRVVSALGLTAEQQANAQKLLAEEFRALEARAS